MRRIPNFFKCTKCNTLVEALNPQCCDEMSCCGKPMEILRPKKSGELSAKHLPVIKRNGSILTVCVGNILHPMTSEHCIKWIELVGNGFEKRINLKCGDDPIVTFHISEHERALSVYAYCNIHGLWRCSLEI